MATRYLTSDREGGVRGSGTQAQRFVYKVDVLATDSSADVLVIGSISPDLIVTGITYKTAGITGLTDVDLGVYKAEEVGGAVIDANMFDDAIDLSTSGTDTGLTGVAVADAYKTVRELAGTTAGNPNQFDLALTLASDPTADGTVTIIVEATQA